MEGQALWYVIQVRTGTEENIRIQCEKFIEHKTVMEACFILIMREKKVSGAMELQKKILFPGYIFIITRDALRLHEALKQVMGLTRILKIGETMIALTQKEVAFMERSAGQSRSSVCRKGALKAVRSLSLPGLCRDRKGILKRLTAISEKLGGTAYVWTIAESGSGIGDCEEDGMIR